MKPRMYLSVTDDQMDLSWLGNYRISHINSLKQEYKSIIIIQRYRFFKKNIINQIHYNCTNNNYNLNYVCSLLKVYLEIRDYRVFIDVVRLKNGYFGHNLLKHLKRAKNFVLVLTKNSLDKCVGDNRCHDWVHKVMNTS